MFHKIFCFLPPAITSNDLPVIHVAEEYKFWSHPVGASLNPHLRPPGTLLRASLEIIP